VELEYEVKELAAATGSGHPSGDAKAMTFAILTWISTSLSLGAYVLDVVTQYVHIRASSPLHQPCPRRQVSCVDVSFGVIDIVSA